MIYELCVLLRPEVGEDGVTNVKNTIDEVLKGAKGEVLLSEDWGNRSLPQATKSGLSQGRYYYCMYRAEGVNDELERRFKINESLDKSLIVRLGEDKDKEKLVRNYTSPFATSDEDGKFRNDNKEKRAFAKKRSCWFTANKTVPTWRDPSSFQWLLNEFGKISPARVSGITAKNQTLACRAIKQARNIGMVAYNSSRVVR